MDLDRRLLECATRFYIPIEIDGFGSPPPRMRNQILHPNRDPWIRIAASWNAPCKTNLRLDYANLHLMNREIGGSADRRLLEMRNEILRPNRETDGFRIGAS